MVIFYEIANVRSDQDLAELGFPVLMDARYDGALLEMSRIER